MAADVFLLQQKKVSFLNILPLEEAHGQKKTKLINYLGIGSSHINIYNYEDV